MNNGWIKMHRQIIDKGWFSKSNYVHVWCYLLIKASFNDKEYMWNGETITLQPGQFVTGRKQISKDLGIPETTIERILTFFEEKEKQIGQQKSSTSRLISILNYSSYQDCGQQTDNKRTAGGQRADTKKEVKELKELKEIVFSHPSDEFKAKYLEWAECRREKKKPLTKTSIKSQMKTLGAYSERIALAMIEKAINSDYQGIFPLSDLDIKKMQGATIKNLPAFVNSVTNQKIYC